VLVGHSMGGYISLAFGRAFPDRLLGLGMVASQAAADAPENKAARYETARKVEADGVGVVAESMPARLTSQPELIENLRRLILKMKPDGVIGDLQGIAERVEMSAWISKVCVPVAVVAGGADALIPLARAQEMAERFPNCKLTVIPQAGHMPMLEAPLETAGALSDLIATVNLTMPKSHE
jgi:pimeloyl-ACP methyl ester carboxylesterase